MSRSSTLLLSIVCLLSLACRNPAPQAAAEEAEGWSVTAWSEHYELFAETDPLIAGREAPSHAHFTYLPDFSALDEGSVTGILRGADGFEESFHAPKPLRAGIFNVVFKPSREGAYELIFAVRNSKASEEIRAGRVRVGAAASPGNLVELPPGAPDEEAAAGEPVGFLKEQQWRTEFATEWAGEGAPRGRVRGGPDRSGRWRGDRGELAPSGPGRGPGGSAVRVHPAGVGGPEHRGPAGRRRRAGG
jgi:cobalt-zinc-cadmium efflux system membrane fusion protein